MAEPWSNASALKKVLFTMAVIPAGIGAGMVLMIPIVGAPHAFPGFLMHASEPVRNAVSLAVVVLTPLAFIYLAWTGVFWRMIFGRAASVEKPTLHRTAADQDLLIARFREKPSVELEAMLATKDQSLYPATTYQLVERVLRERNVEI